MPTAVLVAAAMNTWWTDRLSDVAAKIPELGCRRSGTISTDVVRPSYGFRPLRSSPTRSTATFITPFSAKRWTRPPESVGPSNPRRRTCRARQARRLQVADALCVEDQVGKLAGLVEIEALRHENQACRAW